MSRIATPIPVPAPIPYHGPGLRLAHGGRDYLLWGPSLDRAQWAAAWTDKTGHGGDFCRGQSSGDVLSIFPADVAAVFAAEVSR